MSLLNLLALPYIFFSIYYQWRVAKQWCVLCLGVQALLFLEFITSISTGALQSLFLTYQPITISTLSTIITAFILPIITWYLLKPNLFKAEEGKRNKRELMRIKYNPQIFEALLTKQKRIEKSTEGLGITLGNLKATNTIIKVCNPYCGPCAKAHPEIEKLLEENNNLKVQIIFMGASNEIKAMPIKHLLAIAEKDNESLTKQALDDWYLVKEKDYKVFAEKYAMNGELDKQGEKAETMSEWCKAIEIAFTPTFFMNGYQLPDAYSIGDLKYFLAE